MAPKACVGALEEKVFMLTTGIGSEELVGKSSKGRKGSGISLTFSLAVKPVNCLKKGLNDNY